MRRTAIKTRHPNAVLVTDAARSPAEQLAARRRRYGTLMMLRIPCLVAAAALYHIPGLAALILFASVPLPWMAVLIANDRPPREAARWSRLRRPDRPALPAVHGPADPGNPSA